MMKQRVLIADRDAEFRERSRRYLTKRGYDVETSPDGLDCLTKLQQAAPALLVLDRELLWGGADGVLAWLREEIPAPGFPVLLTASANKPPDLAEFKEHPVVDYLPKPFAMASLLQSIGAAAAMNGRGKPPGHDRLPGYPSLLVE